MASGSGEGKWYWNASPDPFTKGSHPDWRAYSDEDNRIIETKYKANETKANLQNHIIYFKDYVQVHKDDFNRQRPVKRVDKTK